MLLWARSHKAVATIAVISGKAITIGVYALYPIFLAFLLIKRNPEIYRAVIVPAVGFMLLSLVRYLLNFPRPYEKYDITPLYKKSTKGKSYPSRHTFCIFIIAVTLFHSYPAIGIAVAVLGLILATSRVLCGVHFIRDVTVGALSGIILGAIGFYLI